MIKSISYWSLKDGGQNTHSLDAAMSDARAAGFDGLEVAIAKAGVIHTDLTEADCAKLRKQIEAGPVVVETLASGMGWGHSPTHIDPKERIKAIDLHSQGLRIAGWLGLKAMLFVPGAVNIPWNKNYPPVPYDDALRWAGEAVEQLLPVAEKAGVDLCIENVWNGMFYSPVELRDFIDRFSSERAKIYFDVGNVLGYHQYPPHWIALLGSRIGRVHIKDYKVAEGGFKGFCDLLEGDVPWPESMQALKDIGYDRTIVAEMMPWREDLLAKTSAAMDRIMSDV